jgi:transcriptional regulator of acetoin/glycerol metabolism
LTPIFGGAPSRATAGSEAGCAKCAADPFAALLATLSPGQGLEYLLERLVQAAVAKSGSKGKAARLLRVSRNTILRKMGGQSPAARQ